MPDTILLSRPKLTTFLNCPRRFQLRYLRHLSWPDLFGDAQTEEALTRGKQFHLLLERHFLGLDIPLTSIGDTAVSTWYQSFKQHNPVRQNGRFLPEHRLTVPIGSHLLLGRFDLLVIGEQEGEPFAHIYDWKTGRAKGAGELEQDWQTRLYLALLAEGGGALWGDGRSLHPDRITFTYWYAAEPDAPRIIHYSAARHAQNWAEIEAVASQIEDHLQQDEWPLTAERSRCRRCGYQAYCGRQEAGPGQVAPAEDIGEEETAVSLEPALP
jgi:hypothetical protein